MDKGIIVAHKFMPCKALVFDKDGTIIDIYPMLRALAKERLLHLARHVKKEAVDSAARLMGFDPQTGFIEPYGPLASAARRDEVAVCACALWLSGIPWHQAIQTARESYDDADRTLDTTKDAFVLPGVKDALQALHASGLRLFLVTADQHRRAEEMLNHLGISCYFDLIIGADDVEAPKPSPESIAVCSKKAGISPSEMIVVGDAPQDAIMGKKAGARCVGVLTGVGTSQDLEGFCDIVVPSVADIRPSS